MRLKTTISLSIIIAMLNGGFLKGQERTDLNLAKSYFNELDSLCRLDNGNLWGINLYGATMFIFPQNRIIIANEPDTEGKLVPKNGVWIGRLPDNINIANTSFEWNGKNWTMVSWDAIPEQDKYSRDKLLIHESWHRNEGKTGIKPVMTRNTHLDELQCSILLKLEFMALDSALICRRDDIIHHLTNALEIRSYRQSLFPGNNENAFELHEGMPEYTGFKLCGISKEILPELVAKQLEFGLDKDGLANSFPYLTGPAYGLLFDKLDKPWIDEVKRGKSLPEIGAHIIKTEIPSDTILLKERIGELISFYKADSLIKKETAKFEYQQQLIDEYHQKFMEGNILIIRNNDLHFSFNPQERLVSIENGVVYETMRLTGDWGIADVRNGIFRSNDWQYFILPAPTTGKTGKITEPDYDLMLNDGWQVVEITEGKYTLQKE